MRKGLVTTNDQKPTGQGEPVKLNQITTAIIPNAAPRPEPKGDGFAKMITTNDDRDLVDIVSQYTVLEKRGAKYIGLCPFHKEKNPSFTVDREKQLYHCFGCGEGGDIVSFNATINDKVEVKLDKPIDMGADTLADNDSGKIDAERVAAPSHKKAGKAKQTK